MKVWLLKPICRTTTSNLNKATEKSHIPRSISNFCYNLFSFYIIGRLAFRIYPPFKISSSSMLLRSSCYQSYLINLRYNLDF